MITLIAHFQCSQCGRYGTGKQTLPTHLRITEDQLIRCGPMVPIDPRPVLVDMGEVLGQSLGLS